MSFFSSFQQFVNDASTSLANIRIRESARKVFSSISQDEDNEATTNARDDKLVQALSHRTSCKDGSYTPRRVPSVRESRCSRKVPLAPSLSARVGEVKPLGNFLGVSTSRDIGDVNIGRRATSFKQSKSKQYPSEASSSRNYSLPEVVADDGFFTAGRSSMARRVIEKSPKLHPNYTMMPEKWAEVTDTKSGVSNIDNEFLELYGGLQSHHEEKRQNCFLKRRASVCIEEGPPPETLIGIKAIRQLITRDEKELLYKEVIYTIKHKIGLSQNGQFLMMKEDLYSYAKEAFQLDQETHKRLMELATEEKPPIVVVNVLVLEAVGLEAKDPNGFSDPYVMLGIKPGEPLPMERTRSMKEDKSPGFGSFKRGSVDWSAASDPALPLTRHLSAHLDTNRTKSPTSPGPVDTWKQPVSSEMCGSVYVGVTSASGDKNFVASGPPDNKPPVDTKRKKHGSFRLSFKRKDGGSLKKKEREQQQTEAAKSLFTGYNNNLNNTNNNVMSNNGSTTTAAASASASGKTSGEKVVGPLPAKFIRATRVVPRTLSPQWNERFRFDCDDSSTDILHLDIWDHDDETSVLEAAKKLNEVKGMRGLGRYFKQVAQSARTGSQDDFLGSLDIPVRDIPATAVEKWYKLDGRTSKSGIQGSIRLKLWLSTREDRGLSEEEDMSNEIRQQERIFAIFLDYQLKQFKNRPWEWDGGLEEAACTILHQHVIQGDLTEVQVAALRWRQLFEKVRQTPISLKVLYDALRSVEAKWEGELLSKGEEEALADSFLKFTDYGLLLLENHRIMFPPRNKQAMIKLEYLLRCFFELSEMKVFNRCCSQTKELRTEITNALKKGATSLFLSSCDTASISPMLEMGRYRETLKIFTNILIAISIDLEIGQHHYNALFEGTMKLSYFSTVYKQYDKLIWEELCPLIRATCEEISISPNLLLPATEYSHIQQLSSMDETAEENTAQQRYLAFSLFEVCLALREFQKHRLILLPVERKTMSLNAFHEWFEKPFIVWLDVVSQQLPVRVDQAVASDHIINSIPHPELKHSSSARDVTSAFYFLKEVFNQLGWNEWPNNGNLLLEAVKIICSNASLYSDLASKKILSQVHTARKGTFKISEEMCITLNNLEHVSQCVLSVPEDFGIVRTRSSVSSSSSVKQLTSNSSSCDGENAASLEPTPYRTNGQNQERLVELVVNTVEHIDKIAYNIIKSTGDSLGENLKKHIFHLAWSPDSLPTVDAIYPLLEFLDRRLQEVNRCLLYGNYIRCLHVIWCSVLKELKEYAEVSTALQVLAEFFMADGSGLTGQKLYTEQYHEIEIFFSLNKTTTEDLIDMYHRERLADQLQLETTSFGNLSVRVYFNHDCLFVEIIRAKNVLPLDNNGLSDPFVVVELLPKRFFKTPERQTNVQKATLNPVFDECFEFPALLDQCRSEDAMVLFSIFDHDVITANDFGGEAFFALKNVPGVQYGNSSVGNFRGLKHVDLPLMFQENKDHPIINTLTSRVGDKVAQEFVKKQRERILFMD